MSLDRIQKGRIGEDAAAAYLVSNGYRILHRNFRCRLGELDIVARNGEYLVFVEVRTRSSSALGLPQESVVHHKQARLRQLAQFYLSRFGLTEEKCRFDVVGVLLNQAGEVSGIQLWENAF
ncbi:MAG: YraN family protein [Bacillota bacterium]